jgi:hypothetical protein
MVPSGGPIEVRAGRRELADQQGKPGSPRRIGMASCGVAAGRSNNRAQARRIDHRRPTSRGSSLLKAIDLAKSYRPNRKGCFVTISVTKRPVSGHFDGVVPSPHKDFGVDYRIWRSRWLLGVGTLATCISSRRSQPRKWDRGRLGCVRASPWNARRHRGRVQPCQL